MAFSWYKTVTVDHTKVPSTQTDFPVLVSVTDADLKTVGNGGYVQNSSGYDVGFYADSGLTTKLDWETERYIETTGEVIYWVRIASLSGSSDTVFYMAFGDASITTDQSNKTGVWDSGYVMVQHLPDGTTLSATDSTSYANNGTLENSPTATTGKIDGAANLVAASSQDIKIPFAASLDVSAITLSAWIKTSNSSDINQIITADNYPVARKYQFRKNGYALQFIPFVGGGPLFIDGGTNVSTNTWRYVVATIDGSYMRLYVDGVSDASPVSSGGGLDSTSQDVYIGADHNNGAPQNFWDGVLDECRISNIARSSDWITTEFNNQNSPSTFESFGAKTSVGGGVTVSVSGQSSTASQGTVASARTTQLAGSFVAPAHGTLTPDRTVSISGQAGTASQGALAPSHANDLTGFALAVSQGTITATAGGNVSVSLSGLGTASSPGTLGSSRTVSATGNSASVSCGTLAPAASSTLNGGSTTTSLGSVVRALSAGLTGLASTIAQGTVTAGSGVTVALSGQAAGAAGGSVLASLGVALPGSATASAQGSVALGNGVGITGQQLASAQGAIALQRALQLAGTALALGQGNVTATAGGNVSVGISGLALAAAAGTLTRSSSASLAGSAASVAAGVVALQKAFNLLGMPATVTQGSVTYQEGQNVTVNLLGLASAMAAGGLLPELARQLAGQAAAAGAGEIRPVVPPVGGNPSPAPSLNGTFASQNPWRSKVIESAPAGRAGENGCVMGRFAWLAEDGTVTNARLSPTDVLAFVLTQPSGYRSVYWSDGRAVLRPGCPVTLMASGDFWTIFEHGAMQGAQVYADKVTGKPMSGYSAGSEATPWRVVTSAKPGKPTVISTSSAIGQ